MKNHLAPTPALQLEPIPAFNDNYIWLIHNEKHAVVIDPGDAHPVIQFLEQQSLQLDAILITHHHHDHVGGIQALLSHSQDATVYGPAHEAIPQRQVAVDQGDQITLPPLGITLEVLAVPGHTLGHVAYVTHLTSEQPVLFCGDTLFSGGCGRLFEGTPAQMYASLQKLAALPTNTFVCCAHEYTLSNLMWALEVEPDNTTLQTYYEQASELRQAQQPTLPSTIGLELQINPFLRTGVPAIQLSAAAYAGQPAHSPSEVLAQLREWKNNA